MAKAPPNLPSEGDTVRLRGRGAIGVLEKHDKQSNWCRVAWRADGAKSPDICHLFELEKSED